MHKPSSCVHCCKSFRHQLWQLWKAARIWYTFAIHLPQHTQMLTHVFLPRLFSKEEEHPSKFELITIFGHIGAWNSFWQQKQYCFILYGYIQYTMCIFCGTNFLAFTNPLCHLWERAVKGNKCEQHILGVLIVGTVMVGSKKKKKYCFWIEAVSQCAS